MSFSLYLGMTLALSIIIVVGVYSGKNVKGAADFSVGNHKPGIQLLPELLWVLLLEVLQLSEHLN